MANEGITKLNDELLDLNMCFDEDSSSPNKTENTPLTSMMIHSQYLDIKRIVSMYKTNSFINSKVLHFNIQSILNQHLHFLSIYFTLSVPVKITHFRT